MILSLTSFPARLPHIGECLQSIVNLAGEDDRIILWLGQEQFPRQFEDIPAHIRSFSTVENGRVEVRFTKDMRSFKKLIPAIQEFPDEVVVTFDDDIVYAADALCLLRDEHRRDPKAVCAHTVSDVYLHHGKWMRTMGTFGHAFSAQFLRMQIGAGAVLYPPHSLHPIVTDESKFLKLCPTSDDIWFWYCATKQGTRIRKVKRAISRPQLAPWGEIGALSAINEVDGDRVNLEALERILSRDPEVDELIRKTISKHFLLILLSRLHRLFVHYPRQVIWCLRTGGVEFLLGQIRGASAVGL